MWGLGAGESAFLRQISQPGPRLRRQSTRNPGARGQYGDIAFATRRAPATIPVERNRNDELQQKALTHCTRVKLDGQNEDQRQQMLIAHPGVPLTQM
jgi:hypothetical protein